VGWGGGGGGGVRRGEVMGVRIARVEGGEVRGVKGGGRGGRAKKEAVSL